MLAGLAKYAWENTTASIAQRFAALQQAPGGPVRHIGVNGWARGCVSGGAVPPAPPMLAEWTAQLRAFAEAAR